MWMSSTFSPAGSGSAISAGLDFISTRRGELFLCCLCGSFCHEIHLPSALQSSALHFEEHPCPLSVVPFTTYAASAYYDLARALSTQTLAAILPCESISGVACKGQQRTAGDHPSHST
jgi:hypothetical protein